MNAVTEPRQAGMAPAGWRAELSLGFQRRGARSVLATRRHIGPLVVQRALYPEGDAVCHAIVVHPPAGIVGGDALRIGVEVGDGAHALLTTPGAGKWYRSAGACGSLEQRIVVGDGAVCEWLPQESIVYDGAIGELSTEVDIAGSGVFIGSEMSCFGRSGAGERYASGRFAMHTRIRRDGRTLWLERGAIAGGDALLDAPVGLAGWPVAATLLVAAPALDGEVLAACREFAPQAGEGGLTLLPGLLVARWRGPGCEVGRAWLNRLWTVLRPVVAGREAVTPRIWHT